MAEARDRPPDPPDGARVATRERSALLALRVGLGLVWTLNLVFIVDPGNRYFSTFSDTAAAFGPTSLGGPGLAGFVAGHPLVFAVGIAVVTAYLAVSFLLGCTTRAACLVGIGFNGLLLVTQFGQIAVIPGGTDIGPQPLYLLGYGVLLLAGPSPTWAVDGRLPHWWAAVRARRRPAVALGRRPSLTSATGEVRTNAPAAVAGRP